MNMMSMQRVVKFIFLFVLVIGSKESFGDDKIVEITFDSASGVGCSDISNDAIKVVYTNEGMPIVSLSLPDLQAKLPIRLPNGDYQTRSFSNCLIILNVKSNNSLDVINMIAELEIKGKAFLLEGVSGFASVEINHVGEDKLSFPEYIGHAAWDGDVNETFYLKNSKNIDLFSHGMRKMEQQQIELNIKAFLNVQDGRDPKTSDGILKLKTGDLRPRLEIKFTK